MPPVPGAEAPAPIVAIAGRAAEEASGLRGPVVAARFPYLDGLGRAGAVGAVLPPALGHPNVVTRFDGLLLMGGGDLDPATYGARERHPSVYGVDAERDHVDLALVGDALAHGMPVLAVCRGLQVLNVALGGTLHQHVEDHQVVDHEVTLAPDSRVAKAVGGQVAMAHCRHHQAIDRLGDGLIVTARSRDGLVEAAELATGWVVGVQWHPEDTAAGDRGQQGLFDAFVEACRARQALTST